MTRSTKPRRPPLVGLPARSPVIAAALLAAGLCAAAVAWPAPALLAIASLVLAGGLANAARRLPKPRARLVRGSEAPASPPSARAPGP